MVALLTMADRNAIVAAGVYKVTHIFSPHAHDTANCAATVQNRASALYDLDTL